MTPLFSVIIPIYKVEQYLAQCVNSIISQSYKNIEIILVDDGSPDNCPQICDEYAAQDARVTVVHKPNGGLVSARQAGVAVATGDYIACVDGDDWISEKYFEMLAEVIEPDDPDIVCCGSIWASEHSEVKHPYSIPLGLYTRNNIEKQIFPMLIERADGVYFPPSLWAKAFKREIYQRQQLVDASVNIGEDQACVKPCIFQAQSMYVMADCLYYYRQNSASMTKKKKAFDWNGPKIIGQHFEKQIDMSQYDFQDQVYRNVVHNLFNVAVSQFYRIESYSAITKDIVEHIEEPYYKDAIEKCFYKRNCSGTLAHAALKYKLCFLLYLYVKGGSAKKRILR